MGGSRGFGGRVAVSREGSQWAELGTGGLERFRVGGARTGGWSQYWAVPAELGSAGAGPGQALGDRDRVDGVRVRRSEVVRR